MKTNQAFRVTAHAFVGAILLAGSARAQIFGPLKDLPIETKTRPQTPETIVSTAHGKMGGMEFYDEGFYWWSNPLIGGLGEAVRPTGEIGLQNFISPLEAIWKTKAQPNLINTAFEGGFQSVARTATDVYFFGYVGGGRYRLFRRPAGRGPNDLPLGDDFAGELYSAPGAILIDNGTAYWSCMIGGKPEMRYKALHDGLPPARYAPGEGTLGVGLVKKVLPVVMYNQGILGTIDTHVMLNHSGQLYYYSVFGPAKIADGVADFTYREESVPGSQASAIYFTASDGSRSRLIRRDLNNGANKILLEVGQPTACGQPTLLLTSVAADDDRLLVAQTPVKCYTGGFGGTDLVTSGSSLLRRSDKAHERTNPGAWQTIGTGEEWRNLRSNGRLIYWCHGADLRRISTDAPALELDYEACGLEVIQVIQDANQSVPLVAGKRTLVRGYAIERVNSTKRKHQPTAKLEAFRGNQLVGAVWPNNAPALGNDASLATLRGDLNRGFNFDVPSDWIGVGQVRFVLTINPTQAAPETGANPLANNIAVRTVKFIGMGEPTIVFKVMSSTFPNYNLNDPSLWDIVRRAESLLPVKRLHVRFSPGSVTKPVVSFNPLDPGVHQRSFEMPNDKEWALYWLAFAHAFTSDPAPDTHWVGVFPSQVSGFNGLGGTKDVRLSDYLPGLPIDLKFPNTILTQTALIRMGTEGGANPWNSFRGGFALAHELGHNYGRFHIRAPGCESQSPDGPFHNFPGNACNLGPVNLNDPAAPIGFDGVSGSLVNPNMTGDLMTYANSRWTSPFTWNALLNAIPGKQEAAVAQNFVMAAQVLGNPGDEVALNPQPLPPKEARLFVHGIFDGRNDKAVFLPGFRLDEEMLASNFAQDLTTAAAELPADYPVRLRALSANGSILTEQPLVMVPLDNEEEGGSIAFFQVLSTTEEVSKLEIVSDGATVGEQTASAHEPEIVLGAPVYDANEEMLDLSWTASDADGEALYFTTQFSADNGQSWEPVAIMDKETSVSIPTHLLPGGDQVLLRVIATDGLHVAVATTEPFAMPTHRPTLSVQGLSESLPYGSVVSAKALAYDVEDGRLESESISWRISGRGVHTGTGENITLPSLSPGDYALQLKASDIDGNETVLEMNFRVQAMPIRDYPSAGDNTKSLAERFTAAALAPIAPDQSAWFGHENGKFIAYLVGMPRSADKTPAATAWLGIDVAGDSGVTPDTKDLLLTIREDGAFQMSAGKQGAWAEAPVPVGTSVRVEATRDTWSAEIRLPDTALGGWNHPAKLVVSTNSFLGVSLPFTNTVLAVPRPVLNWPMNATISDPSQWADVVFLSQGIAAPGEVTPPAEPNQDPVATNEVPANPNPTNEETVNPEAPSNPSPEDISPEAPNPSVDVEPTAPSPSQGEVSLLGIEIDPKTGDCVTTWHWSGQPGVTLQIEASGNLAKWEVFAEVSLDQDNRARCVDPAANHRARCFYRARVKQP